MSMVVFCMVFELYYLFAWHVALKKWKCIWPFHSGKISKVTTQIYHGDVFIDNPFMAYIGARIAHFDNCNIYKLSIIKFECMVKEIRYKEWKAP